MKSICLVLYLNSKLDSPRTVCVRRLLWLPRLLQCHWDNDPHICTLQYSPQGKHKKYSDLLQTYRIYHPSMIYITYFPSKFLNSTWNKLQDWTFWLFFLPNTFKQCPFQTLTVSDSSQHSGNFFQRNNSHYTKKWKQWKSDKDNDCNHVTYFLALASLVHSF